MSQSKGYRQVMQKIEQGKRYDVAQAFKLVVDTKHTKFDEMVDVAIRLGIDPKQSDQNIRGAVALPNGTGKKLRIIVFAKGEKQTEAKEAGADFVGDEDLINKIDKEGWLAFDVAIATPDMMKSVSRIAKILGPRGLMPNPKIGTVTFDVAKAVKESQGGKIESRAEKAGIMHASLGKASFANEKLKENFLALMEALWRVKPASAKGAYIRSASISTTMGPGVTLDTTELNKMAK